MTDVLPQLLTIEEAAMASRRTAKAMRQLRFRGTGPKFRKIGGRVLISTEDLAEWLKGTEAAP